MITIDIAIPVLNEELHLKGCLDSVLNFALPGEVTCTIYILDGGSTDRTRDIAEEYRKEHKNIILLYNAQRIQSCALNMVIRQGNGDYLLRLDAHSYYPENYLELCLETADKYGADNVGGCVVTRPGGSCYQAALVQGLTTHWFGVGNSAFRLSPKEAHADTVPYGFFKRSVFDRIGYFDERLVRAQDYEMNRRITNAGGQVWLNPKIEVYYYNQPCLLKFYEKQIFKEAPYNAYLWWVAPYAFAPRHAVTSVFAIGVLGGITLSHLIPWLQQCFTFLMILYCLLACLSSLQQAIRYHQFRHMIFLPFCFFGYHFLHGIGVLGGIFRLLTRTAPVQRVNEPWPGAGRYRAWPI